MHPTFDQLRQASVLGRNEADPLLQQKQTGFSRHRKRATEETTVGFIPSYTPGAINDKVLVLVTEPSFSDLETMTWGKKE